MAVSPGFGEKRGLKEGIMKKLLIVLGAIGLIALLIWLVPIVTTISAEDIVEWSPSSPILTALVFLALFCLKNVLMFLPLLAFYIAAGMIFPTGWALALTWFCLACEMSLGYWIGRKIGFEKILAKIQARPRAGMFLDLVNRNQSAACFLTRVIPLPVPIDLMSMFYGATKTPFATYLAFSLLGISIPMVPCVIAGNAVTDPLSPEFLVPFGIAVLVAGGAFTIYMLVQRRKKKAAGKAQAPPVADAQKPVHTGNNS